MTAFLASVVWYANLRHTKLHWFVPFLLFIVVVEIYGRYVAKVLHTSNTWIYNISTTIEFIFYSYIFYHSYHTKKFRKIIQYFAIIYPLLVMLNISLFQKPPAFHSYTMALGCLAMIIFSGFFFIDLLRNEHKLNLLRLPMFWIASGLLFFYLGSFLFHAFYNIIVVSKVDIGGKLFRAINNNLIFVLYGSFIVAFICPRKVNK